MSNFTLQEQMRCVEREIAMRERVYPRWVAMKKMTQIKADYELNCMKEVLATLESVNQKIEEYTK